MSGARAGGVAVWLTAVLVTGCASDADADRPSREHHRSSSPSTAAAVLDPWVEGLLDDRAALDRLLEDPRLSFDWVKYTSPSDAAAELSFCDPEGPGVDCQDAVLTTDDNWAHAVGLAIPDTLTNLVWSEPLPGGSIAVAIQDQDARVAYSPFILQPDGSTVPLHVSPAGRDPGASNVLIFEPDIPEAEDVDAIVWAVDPEAAELYPLLHQPCGCWWLDGGVKYRHGSVLAIRGWKKGIGEGTWRFDESNDNGRSWQSIDTAAPLGPLPSDAARVSAVGPAHMQAVAVTQEPQDRPSRLRALWVTENEQTFQSLPLTIAGTRFGGIGYALDGTLFLADDNGHRLWRLPPRGAALEPLSDGPRLSHPQYAWVFGSSGGVLIASTGRRTLAVSTDGDTWTTVEPGQ